MIWIHSNRFSTRLDHLQIVDSRHITSGPTCHYPAPCGAPRPEPSAREGKSDCSSRRPPKSEGPRRCGERDQLGAQMGDNIDHLQSLLHIGKRETIGLGGKVVEKLVREFDPLVLGQLLLPIDGVLSALGLDGVRKRATKGTCMSEAYARGRADGLAIFDRTETDGSKAPDRVDQSGSSWPPATNNVSHSCPAICDPDPPSATHRCPPVHPPRSRRTTDCYR